MKKQITEEEEVETEEVDIPKGWNDKINRVAKQWLEDEYPESICPALKYLRVGSSESKEYCRDFCYVLFPEAYSPETPEYCPCDMLDLEEVKSRVEKVVEQWGKEDEEREIREFFET
jgi:hypothetical protein